MSVILGKVTFFHCPWVWNSEYHFFKATLELRLSTQWQTVTTASKNLQVTVHEDLPHPVQMGPQVHSQCGLCLTASLQPALKTINST